MKTAEGKSPKSFSTAAEFEAHVQNLFRNGDYRASIPLIRKIIKDRENRRAGKSVTARWLEKLGICLSQTGRHEESIRVLRGVLTEYQQNHPVGHSAVLLIRWRLACALADGACHDEALPALQEVCREAAATFGVVDYRTLRCYARLLEYLEKRRLWDELIAVGHEVLSNCRDRSVMRGQARVIAMMRSVSMAHGGLRQYDAAISFRLGALQLARREWGAFNTRVLLDQQQLARLYFMAGEYDRCWRLLQETMQSYVTTFGADHASTIAMALELKRHERKIYNCKSFANRKRTAIAA